VGNSIGSLVCLTVAYTYPDMVAGITMLSLPDVAIRQEAIPKPLQPIVMGIEGLFASHWLLKNLFLFLRQPSVIRRWAGVAYIDQNAVNEELIAILTLPAQDQGADRTFYRLFDAVRSPNFAPSAKVVLPRLDIPILLIWGLQDRMVPPLLAPIFAKLNPLIELVELAGVGHCPQDECPEKFNPILKEWLTRHFSH
jgi:pimeloyl-ACP methyl ester carboxylesterase